MILKPIIVCVIYEKGRITGSEEGFWSQAETPAEAVN